MLFPLCRSRLSRHSFWNLKLFYFLCEFQLTQSKLSAIRDVCLFAVTTYLEPWFTATDPVVGPRIDLQFLQNILKCRETSPSVGDLAVKGFRNHLWYLAEESVALSFFDPLVSLDTKFQMVAILHCPSLLKKPRKKFTVSFQNSSMLISHTSFPPPLCHFFFQN